MYAVCDKPEFPEASPRRVGDPGAPNFTMAPRFPISQSCRFVFRSITGRGSAFVSFGWLVRSAFGLCFRETTRSSLAPPQTWQESVHDRQARFEQARGAPPFQGRPSLHRWEEPWFRMRMNDGAISLENAGARRSKHGSHMQERRSRGGGSRLPRQETVLSVSNLPFPHSPACPWHAQPRPNICSNLTRSYRPLLPLPSTSLSWTSLVEKSPVGNTLATRQLTTLVQKQQDTPSKTVFEFNRPRPAASYPRQTPQNPPCTRQPSCSHL
jgi:hypothetical protein